MTASAMGGSLRHDLEKADWNASDVVSFSHPVEPSKLVTWVESHDTYCNGHESAHLTDTQIRLGWVFLTARQGGTPLFYSRPDGSDGPSGNWWGNNLVGAKGNDNFKHPLVTAANKFRRQMHGQPESLAISENGAVTVVSRGRKGAVIINLSAEAQQCTVATTLPNGNYRDLLTGQRFQVRKGQLCGQVEAQSAYILVK